jgi:hypothetical protein
MRRSTGKADRPRSEQGGTLPPGKCSEESQQKRNDPGSALRNKGNPGSFSSRERTRTSDPVINSHLLYQLSYAGMFTSLQT